jgi:hypothetical protein
LTWNFFKKFLMVFLNVPLLRHAQKRRKKQILKRKKKEKKYLPHSAAIWQIYIAFNNVFFGAPWNE